MASFILKGLVTNDGIDRLKWHQPFVEMASTVKMALTVYEREIRVAAMQNLLYPRLKDLYETKD